MPDGMAARMLTIGISACLAGCHTRYDGGNKPETELIARLSASGVTLLPVCPEAECGLGVPREIMRLEGDPENPRLMTITTRRDLTGRMTAWCAQWLNTLKESPIHGLILKSRSPSCGRRVAVYHGVHGICGHAAGLFACTAMDRLPELPMADEEELADPDRLAAFLDRVGLTSNPPPSCG